MKTLRIILYSDGVYKGLKTGYLKYFDSIIGVLKNNFIVEEIWVGAIGGVKSDTYLKNVEFYNMFSFTDSNQLIDRLNPDLILIPNSQEYLSRSLLFATRHKLIPSVIAYSGAPYAMHPPFVKMIFVRFSQLPYMGKMFFKKYLFLLRTMFRSNYNFSYVIRTIIKDFYSIFTSFLTEFKDDDADLYLCNNYDWARYAKKNGIPKEKIVVVGEYAVDSLYDRIHQLKPKTHGRKIEIILLTTALALHGVWSRKTQDKIVKTIIQEINDNLKDKVNFRIKIHPTSEKLDDYKKIIDDVDSSCEIIQHGDLLELFNESDVIITFGESTSLIEALLLHKPILYFNPFKEIPQYVKDKVAMEFKNISDLITYIKNEEYCNINLEKIDEYLKEKLFKFDGRCGERAAHQILLLLKNREP